MRSEAKRLGGFVASPPVLRERVLAPYSFRRTVILAATDMEEIGLFGARALLASKLTQERRVLAAINYETMAYTSTQPNSQSLSPGLGLLYPGQIKRARDRQLRGDFTCVIYNG